MTTSTVDSPTVTVQMKRGAVVTPFEDVDDHLAITPGFSWPPDESAARFTGRFTLTHKATGLRIGPPACIDCIRAAAAALVPLALVWPAEGQKPNFPEEHTAAIRSAFAHIASCECDGTCYVTHCSDEQHP
ncbi:MAG TPA: hypothetical protein VFB74_22425 [Kribbellaceae bacterium]|nr:hypothetical protein [Kribbellaceae bacterium]